MSGKNNADRRKKKRNLTRRYFFVAQYILNLAQKGIDILKLSVNGRKADICHVVYFFKTFHYHIADFAALDFVFGHIISAFFDFGDESFYLAYRDGAFFAGFNNAASDFFDIEGLPVAALFDDIDRYGFDFFVCRKSFGATDTFSSASDNRSVLAYSGIDDLTVHLSAIHTLHAFLLLIKVKTRLPLLCNAKTANI
jgi:hypothetical protein